MHIGLAVAIRSGNDIHQSSADQYTYQLMTALKASPLVKSVALISNNGVKPSVDNFWVKSGVRIFQQAEADCQFDIIVETTAALDQRFLQRQQARGTKVVMGSLAHPYFGGWIEPMIFSKAAFVTTPDRYDQVWLHGQYEVFAPMVRTLFKAPVHIVPFLWTSQFIGERATELENQGQLFRWQPGQDFNVAILEHNTSLTGSYAIPLLIAEQFERGSKTQGKMKHVYVLNTEKAKQHATLVHMASSFDIVKHHLASFENALDQPAFMAQYANVVVSHQWHQDQRASHLELLWAGYPLVHNSEWLNGTTPETACGYYYPEFNVVEGAEALEIASHHGKDEYQRRHALSFARMVRKCDPLLELNVGIFTQRLMELTRKI